MICKMTKWSTQEIRWKFTSFSLLQVSQPSDNWCLSKLYTKSIPAHRNTIRVQQTNQSVNPVNGNNFIYCENYMKCINIIYEQQQVLRQCNTRDLKLCFSVITTTLQQTMDSTILKWGYLSRKWWHFLTLESLRHEETILSICQ
jgi:hypothetical protein